MSMVGEGMPPVCTFCGEMMASVSGALQGQNSCRRSHLWSQDSVEMSPCQGQPKSQVAWQRLLCAFLSSLPSSFSLSLSENNEIQLVEGRVKKDPIYFKQISKLKPPNVAFVY